MNPYIKKNNKLWALNFNKTCINENLRPTFTKYYKEKGSNLFALFLDVSEAFDSFA